ncbi:MAG TPA: hypothetical protein VKP30_12370 [Polyangiaceae bacterium]|nr:hypothetical protein [Polyangiaceae bacterium]
MSRMESPDARLVELLRRSDAPSADDMWRVRRAVGMRVAVGAAASTALVATTRTSWAARLGTLGGWGKGLLLASSLAGAGVGTWYLQASQKTVDSPLRRSNAVLDSGSTQTKAPPASVADEPSARAPSEEHSAESEKTRVTTKAASRGAPSTLEAELALLGKAQHALKSGQPNDALRALDEHARRFPSGVLSAERTGVKPVALCQAGRLDEGRAAARSYLRVVPNSVLSKRIRVACQLPDE